MGAASLCPLQGQHQGLYLLIETKSSSPGWVRGVSQWCVPGDRKVGGLGWVCPTELNDRGAFWGLLWDQL